MFSGWLLRFSVGQNSVTKVLARLVPWGGCERESFPWISPSFWWLPAALAVSLHPLPPSSHHFLPVFLICVFVAQIALFSPL